MKQLFKPLLTALLLLCSIIVSAHDFEVDGIYYNVTSDKTVGVTYKGNGPGAYENEYVGSVIIPTMINFYGTTFQVTSIESAAFYFCRNLISITIPNSVTNIGEVAFYNCNSLKSIIIPNSVVSIGEQAFQDCSSLDSVSIGNRVATIGKHAFDGCKNITNIIIPKSVKKIGESSFSKCENLKSIYIEDSEEILDFSDRQFEYHENLETLYLGRNIDATTFSSSSLKNITLSKYVTSIESDAFCFCRNLISITIPNSVTNIGKTAFRECNSLKSIIIPNSVVSIGDQAFYNCSSLDSVSIGNGVATIGNSAFSECKNINSVNISNIANWCNINFGNSEASPFVYAKNVYINNVLAIDLYIPNEVSSISNYAFNCCASISKVEFPNSINSIGDVSFKSCNNLTEIIIGSNVSKIGESAFKDCNNLKEIISYIPKDKLNSTGINAFSGVNKTTCTLYVPYGAKEKYSTTSGWKDFKNIVEIKTTYKVTFVVDDKEFTIDSVAEGDKIIYPEIPEKEGYTFMWNTNIDIMPSNDITITGKYVANSYLLTYKIDGNVYASDSITYGATITPIAEPTKEGHTFSGWSEIPETMPANDVVIEGSFSINSYTVTYKVDGEVYKTETIEYGATIEPIEAPTKEGHTFSGWSEIPETMPANDVIVEGTFSINSYTLTYKVDGEVYKTGTVEYGATITPIEAPTKEGHTFIGWSEIPETMPANDVVIEGSFSINSYTVTFMVDGEVYETMTVEYGAEIELPTPPEKEGYIFTGWIDVPATMPAEDIVIEGRFEIDTTGINAVILDLEKNEVYNLKGQRITESENLTRGIYIINGKKVYIK